MCGNARTFYCVRNILQSNFLTHDNSIKGYDVQNHNLYMVKRFKSNRRKIIDDVINNDNSQVFNRARKYKYIYIYLYFSYFIKNFLT